MSKHDAFDKNTRIKQAIIEHGLPLTFFSTVEQFYRPLAQQLYLDFTQGLENTAKRGTQFIGIQGSQGSGKSTCADFLKLLLELECGLRVLVASIDDFYLTLAQRQALAESTHPLFITRGVPGTHDVAMMQAMFDAAEQQAAFTVPVFDKSQDDRAPVKQWQHITEPVDVFILEGWCVGVTAQETPQLFEPINDLESEEDSSAEWRKHINHALQNEYAKLFARLDFLVALQAPSFECVFGWRCLQEEKMIARLTQQGGDIAMTQTPQQLKRFIAHYQRLTEHALRTMPEQADYVLWLDQHHRFTQLERQST